MLTACATVIVGSGFGCFSLIVNPFQIAILSGFLLAWSRLSHGGLQLRQRAAPACQRCKTLFGFGPLFGISPIRFRNSAVSRSAAAMACLSTKPAIAFWRAGCAPCVQFCDIIIIVNTLSIFFLF
jgi:hypothetical protein